MTSLEKQPLADFTEPTGLPSSPAQAKEWQRANEEWWETHPMRYDWADEIPFGEFTREFYEEIDRRFFANSREYLAPTKAPFGEFIDVDSLEYKEVLEIGVGNGSHAQLLAAHAREFTGIDITDYAVQSTARRLSTFGLPGSIRRMDAERLEFPDRSFDFIWSWGVIHHSSNTERILREMHRVLRPGGEAVVMVYHRGWWNYYAVGILWALLSGTLFKTKSLTRAVQQKTDGAIARYYTAPGWRRAVQDLFSVVAVTVCGPKTDIVPLPQGALKRTLMRYIPDSLNRFLTRRCRMGVFLVSRLRRLR